MQQGVKQNIKKNSSYYFALTLAGTLFGSKIANCNRIFEYKIKREYRGDASRNGGTRSAAVWVKRLFIEPTF